MGTSWIACRVSSYGKYESVAYEHLASLGVRYVEIVAPAPDAVARVQTELRRYGLAVSSMHAECDVTQPDCAARVAAQLPVFQALGVRYMFVSCNAGTTLRSVAYERLRAAGAAAAKAGVLIVMETHPDLITNADVALETMRGVDHPHVRVNFDTANIYYYNEGVDGLAELRKVLAYVGALHLKDTNGRYRTWHFPALGQGCVDFPGVFALLDSVSFRGPLTMEIEGCEGEPDSEDLVRQRIADSVEYLKSLGRM